VQLHLPDGRLHARLQVQKKDTLSQQQQVSKEVLDTISTAEATTAAEADGAIPLVEKLVEDRQSLKSENAGLKSENAALKQQIPESLRKPPRGESAEQIDPMKRLAEESEALRDQVSRLRENDRDVVAVVSKTIPVRSIHDIPSAVAKLNQASDDLKEDLSKQRQQEQVVSDTLSSKRPVESFGKTPRAIKELLDELSSVQDENPAMNEKITKASGKPVIINAEDVLSK
jgi:uncharacterized protein YicC (UPF0701 family)